MVAQLKLYQHWTTNIIYRSSEALQEAYKKLGIVINQGYEWDIADEDIMKNILASPQFRDYHKWFCDLKSKEGMLSDSEEQELETISTKHPILVEGYSKLGVNTLRRLRTMKAINAALEELEER